MQRGVFYRYEDQYVVCNGGSQMYLEQRPDGTRRWRCNGRIRPETGTRCCHGSTQSLRTDTMFYGSNLRLSQHLTILYLWILKTRRMAMADMVGVSPATIRLALNRWYQVLQEDIQNGDVKIGGEGVIVEIDESKFGKRKYHRGHRVDGNVYRFI